jgi:hypothetical protein
MNRLLIIVVAITSLLFSCNSAKKIQTPVVIKDTAVVEVVELPADNRKADSITFIKETYKKILDNNINFTTFSGKIELDYKDADGKNTNANAHIRMYSDSVIWVLLTGPLGIEGVRVYITKDSVKLLYKQEKIYTVRSISFLQEVTALPLSLSTLQDLLLGNPVFLDSNITSYSKTGSTIMLQSYGAFFSNLLTIGDTDKRLLNSRLEDADTAIKRSCYLTYADYESNNQGIFSTKRTINIIEKKKSNIKLDFKQFEFNETLSFPFSVPKNYTQN